MSKGETKQSNMQLEIEAAHSRLKGALHRYGVAKSENSPSATEEDERRYGQNDLINPVHSHAVLKSFLESSAELGNVISSMIANTVGYGYRLIKREHVNGDLDKAQLLDERIDLENFFSYANARQCLTLLLEEAEWDYYLTGNMYFEITRNSKGKPDGITRIPSYQIRGTKLEANSVRVPIKQLHRTRDGYTIVRRYESLKFRRYAQVTSSSFGGSDTKKVWFKEFQDPRIYHRDTGEIAKTEADKRQWKKLGKVAHEIIHIAAPAKRGIYGLPYYIGNVSSVRGDILAENINIATFENNNIPSMFIGVSGGQLTSASIDRLTQLVESKTQGNDNRSRFVLLESTTPDMDDLDSGRSKITIEPMTQVQHNDAMFQRYSDECRAAIRRSFRLPEILVGRGLAAGGAVVAANMKLADEQVFSQDRMRFTDWINRRLLPELGIVNWKLELNSPNATDPQTLGNLLSTAEKTGGMTPEISRMIIEMILGQDLPEFSGEFDKTIPFSLIMAEAVKKINESGANNPTGSNEPEPNNADKTEPTQQFTSNRAGDGKSVAKQIMAELMKQQIQSDGGNVVTE